MDKDASGLVDVAYQPRDRLRDRFANGRAEGRVDGLGNLLWVPMDGLAECLLEGGLQRASQLFVAAGSQRHRFGEMLGELLGREAHRVEPLAQLGDGILLPLEQERSESRELGGALVVRRGNAVGARRSAFGPVAHRGRLRRRAVPAALR